MLLPTAYLLALDSLLLQIKIVASQVSDSFINCQLERQGLQLEPVSLPLLMPTNLQSMLVAVKLRGLPYTLEELPAYYSLKKSAEELLTQARLGKTEEGYQLRWLFGQQLSTFQLQVSEFRMKELGSLHNGIYLLEEGYQAQEVIGEGIYVINPNGYHHFITGKSCNCKEFLYDLHQKHPCTHIHVAQAYIKYQQDYGQLHPPN